MLTFFMDYPDVFCLAVMQAVVTVVRIKDFIGLMHKTISMAQYDVFSFESISRPALKVEVDSIPSEPLLGSADIHETTVKLQKFKVSIAKLSRVFRAFAEQEVFYVLVPSFTDAKAYIDVLYYVVKQYEAATPPDFGPELRFV